jgi:hypothetical protein
MKKSWLLGLLALCLIVAATDLLYEKHGYFGVEHWPAFYALAGLAGSLLLLLGAIGLRDTLQREAEYYGEDPDE